MLITLAIIGVVAALTIPTLVANYQKKALVTQLQKTYSTLQNGFRLMLATEGVEQLSKTQFALDINWTEDNNPTTLTQSIKKNFPKYFKIAKVCSEDDQTGCDMRDITYTYLNGEVFGQIWADVESADIPYIQFQDGSILSIVPIVSPIDGVNKSFALYFDTNGKKGPNILGRDLFGPDSDILAIDNTDGSFKIVTECEFGGLSYTDIEESTSNQLCGEITSNDISQATGIGCIDRIKAEGWKMNY